MERRGKLIALLLALATLAFLAVAWTQRDALSFELRVRQDFEAIGRNEQGYREYRHRRTGIVSVRLPRGRFTMGGTIEEEREVLASCPAEEREIVTDSLASEEPRHEVTLSPFLMAKYEVTQAQWRKVMGYSPSLFRRALHSGKQ